MARSFPFRFSTFDIFYNRFTNETREGSILTKRLYNNINNFHSQRSASKVAMLPVLKSRVSLLWPHVSCALRYCFPFWNTLPSLHQDLSLPVDDSRVKGSFSSSHWVNPRRISIQNPVHMDLPWELLRNLEPSTYPKNPLRIPFPIRMQRERSQRWVFSSTWWNINAQYLRMTGNLCLLRKTETFLEEE